MCDSTPSEGVPKFNFAKRRFIGKSVNSEFFVFPTDRSSMVEKPTNPAFRQRFETNLSFTEADSRFFRPFLNRDKHFLRISEHPPLGLVIFLTFSLGSSCLATQGFEAIPLWGMGWQALMPVFESAKTAVVRDASRRSESGYEHDGPT